MYQDNNSVPQNRGPIRTLTAAGTLSVQDNLLEVDATLGAYEVALPAASLATGFQFTIKKIDTTANAVTLNPSSTETIDGELTAVISAQWQSLVIESDGVGWLICSQNIGEATPVFSGDITFTKEAAHSILVATSTTANTAGGALSMLAGAGVGTGNGGALALAGGASPGTGTGGAASLTGGAATAGTGGASSVVGGAGTTAGGAVALTGGAATTTGGAVSIAGGAATTTGGAVTIDGGAAGTGGAITIGGTNAASVAIGRTGIVTRVNGNIGVGLSALGTAAALCIGLSNAATRPTTSVDMVQLYGTDIAAGAASLGIEAEEAVAAEVIAASTHVVRIKWNNVMYKILLSNV